jgi:ketosteroid isomerase-like protein
MGAVTATNSGRDVIEQFLAAAEAMDAQAMAALAHDDLVMEWPQSGERFTGRERALAAVLATGERPSVAGPPEVVGAGDIWVVRMPLRYGEDIYHYVGILQLDGGRIRRSTEFFGAPFPANPARAEFTDPSAPTGDAQ